MSRLGYWLAAVVIALLMSAVGPSEYEAAIATAADLNDAIAQAGQGEQP